jgi:hypothetical protein
MRLTAVNLIPASHPLSPEVTMRYLLLGLLLLAACVPQATDLQSGDAPHTLITPPADRAQLAGQTIQIPDSQASVLLDDAILAQSRAPYDVSAADRGVLRLLSNHRLEVQIEDTTYLLMPLEISRIVGVSGLYLLLFEWQNDTLVQLDNSYLGPALNVRALELIEGKIQLTAIDRRVGSLPDIRRPPAGGVFRFIISESRLTQPD